MVTPQQPFSTLLALAIMKLIHDHDLELNALRANYAALTAEQLATQLQAIDAKIADQVLDTCRASLATLEEVVDHVLKIEEQMRLLRNA